MKISNTKAMPSNCSGHSNSNIRESNAMINLNHKKYSRFWMLLFMTFFAGVLVCDDKRASALENTIPDDLIIEETYQPGPGQSVGRVQLARGKAVIRHEKESRGYLIREGMDLYNGDTIYTAGDGHVELTLNDGSSLVLSSDTVIAIDKSIYDPDSGSRLSFFNMLSGKARFIVKKLSDYKHSQFNVKTESSVVGVRGSDFVLEIIQQGNKTIITAGGTTVLEIIDPSNPLQEPVIVTSFQQLVTVLGEITGQPVDISEGEFMSLLESLGLLSSGGGTGPGGFVGPGGGGSSGPGGGFLPDGGTTQVLGSGLFSSSLFFGPANPLPPPIDDPGPDNTNNDDPENFIVPPLPPQIPELIGFPKPPAVEE